MSDETLIGKKVYQTSNYGIHALLGTIDRVTKTQAIVRQHKFRLPLNGRNSPIGETSWSIYGYELETPELNEKWRKNILLTDINAALAIKKCEDKYTEQELETVYKILVK